MRDQSRGLEYIKFPKKLDLNVVAYSRHEDIGRLDLYAGGFVY